MTAQALAAAEAHFGRRIDAVRVAVSSATDLQVAMTALLELAARWTPDALAMILGDGMELASWRGREEVFRDEEDAPAAFAFDPIRQAFPEQIEFMRQKRPMPTKRWLDALMGVHDRAMVVAGANDVALVEDFQEAMIDAFKNGRSVDDFAKDFDRIVEKYGWEYRGERNWRIRTIFETNLRTSFMAGRLRQMRDPDVIKLRPFWQYLHGESRTPKVPRPVHQAWDQLVLMWDDPWWEVHFPPNDWLCSCGVRTLSKFDLEKLGKSGPDESPRDAKAPIMVRGVGLVNQPVGVGYGWDYMPGDHWARGVVPSQLLNDALAQPPSGKRFAVSIDQAEAIQKLVSKARPFSQKAMPKGLTPEEYIASFQAVFEAQPSFRAPFWIDRVGHKLVIDDEIFRDRQGQLKIHVGDRGPLAPLLAEAIIDPDEVWLGVREIVLPSGYVSQLMTRRYIRVDPATGLFAAFDLGNRFWTGITGFRPAKSYDGDKSIKTNWSYLTHERVGKLLWKRNQP